MADSLVMPGDRPLVHIYSDGACSPNPGWGGWGTLVIARNHGDVTREFSGAEANSPNNRMELPGAIVGLAARNRPCTVVMHTDSQYLHNAFVKKWLGSWQKNGWLTAARKPVVNQDLWRELIELAGIHDLEWKWVRGHADNELLNRCDALAVAARLELQRKATTGS
jgi:ribonuclease HI